MFRALEDAYTYYFCTPQQVVEISPEELQEAKRKLRPTGIVLVL